MVRTAGPAITTSLTNSAEDALLVPLIDAVRTVPKMGVGVGVGAGVTVDVGVGVGVVGVAVGVGVGVGGNMPATMTPRCPVSISCVKFLIVKNTPSLT